MPSPLQMEYDQLVRRHDTAARLERQARDNLERLEERAEDLELRVLDRMLDYRHIHQCQFPALEATLATLRNQIRLLRQTQIPNARTVYGQKKHDADLTYEDLQAFGREHYHYENRSYREPRNY